MSKIICDVCGTSYPETATQCPICGCVRSGDPVTVSGDTNDADIRQTTSYTYTKGGRFSKSNVRRRNAGKPVYNAESTAVKDTAKVKEKKTEKGLIAVVVVLLFVIAAVVIYIALNVFDVKLPFFGADSNDVPAGTNSVIQQTTDPADTTEPEIPCQSIKVSDSVVEFDKKNAAQLLNVKATPQDHTDEITFSSADESVATVDANGKITAVGNGQTVITIVCGDQTIECDVICNIPEETTAPTVPEVTYTKEDFVFYNSDAKEKDLTFNISTDKSFALYRGEIPKDLIEWKSDNEAIVKFANGELTFVGTGVTNVHATYQDMTYECIIRVY